MPVRGDACRNMQGSTELPDQCFGIELDRMAQVDGLDQVYPALAALDLGDEALWLAKRGGQINLP